MSSPLSVLVLGAAALAPSLVPPPSNTPPSPLPPALAALPSSTALPGHLAVIMDGNHRWAQQQRLPTALGHERGVASLRTLISDCANLGGVRALTVYAFSSENWGRPPAEVDSLMGLIQRTLEAEADALAEGGVRLAFLGDLERLPPALGDLCRRLAARPAAAEQRLLLSIALSYGGRQSVAAAARSLAERVAAGALQPSEIDEAALASELSHQRVGAAAGDPDLLLRTGGQRRLSNFLLYECAYAELVYTDCLWPAFGSEDLAGALSEYSERSRTLGVR